MKKIMFNDKYGLTAAVLRGEKTQTRRDATRLVEAYWNGRKLGDYPTLSLGGYVRQHAAYKVGDVEYIDPIRIEGMDIATDMLITSDREDVGFDGVWPIPLTLKILYKNGFQAGIYGCIALMEEGASFSLIKGYEGDFWWTCRGEPIVKIKFVHELQHALRLCGIKKEIVL